MNFRSFAMVLCCLSLVAESFAAGPGNIVPVTEKSLKNARLKINLEEGGTEEWKFKNGEYRYGKGPGDPETVYASITNLAIGDLNGDGVADGVVVVGTNTGGSGIFCSVNAVIAGPRGPVATEGVFIGDRTVIKSLKIQSGRIVLKVIAHGPKDPLCCPSKRKTLVFRVRDGKLSM
jgi:hypothetical protein